MRGNKDTIFEDPGRYVPAEIGQPQDPQTAIPNIARDARLVRRIEAAVQQIPTSHELNRGDARLAKMQSGSVHLVVTSPPYWTLKEYRQGSDRIA